MEVEVKVEAEVKAEIEAKTRTRFNRSGGQVSTFDLSNFKD